MPDRTAEGSVETLLGLRTAPDAFRPDIEPADLARLQLAAADERFQQQRATIAVLDQRAREFGIDAIKSVEDVVPLLFTHSVYKSYPESFLTAGRWNRLGTWLGTIAATDVSDVDIADVADIDDWIARLEAAGLHLVVTSGTSGKQSFLPMDTDDVELTSELAVRLFAYPHDVDRTLRRPVTLLAPGTSRMRYSYSFRAYSTAFGRDGAIGSLTTEPMLVADAIETARLRKAMLGGTVAPSELAALEERDRARAQRTDGRLTDLAERILSHRDEPQIMIGPWATFWRIKEIAEAKGVEPGSFHPGTVASVSGGLKGLTLPADYQEQLAAFLGPVVRPRIYGMSELSTALPMCEQGRYHPAPWIVLIVLDESGEALAVPSPDGTTTGRAAFYDPVWNARWGGLVTGDRITVAADPCACGRPGRTVTDPVTRYRDLNGDDDKLTCGGTIEQYIRGVVER